MPTLGETMHENPYAPSRVDINATPIEIQAPDGIRKKIRQAWVAGLFSFAITLIFTLMAILGKSIHGFGAWQLLDVAMILGLTFGIYKKSRICATVMLVYFVASKAMLIAETGNVAGHVTSLIFLYFYAQGVYGTFAYHQHVRRMGLGGD